MLFAVSDLGMNNALFSFTSRAITKIHKIETRKQGILCSTLLRSNSSVSSWTTFHFPPFKFVPYPVQYYGSLSMKQCWVHNAHLRDMRLVYKTTTETWPVHALTRVANEVPAFVELTQPRIHCIAFGNNRFCAPSLSYLPPLFLSPLSLSLVRSLSTPFRSGSIFRFAFSSFSLASFLRECDSSFHVCPLANSAFAILARRLFSFRVQSPFLRRLFSFIVYHIRPVFTSSYRIEIHFWHSLSSIKMTGRI